MSTMKIILSGASGFVGSALVDHLAREGHSLILLTRRPRPLDNSRSKSWLTWQPGTGGDWQHAVDGADGVINLAGEPIAAKRWSTALKERIRSSRLRSTAAIVEAIGKARNKPKFLLNASAVGYYGGRGDEILSEESPPGDDFLARLCVEWELAAKKAEEFGVRVALLRTGIVLGKGQGALAKMAPPYKFFVGGPLGSGEQWMPWIHIEDEVGLILFLVEHAQASGPFNATAPNPVTMNEFAKALGAVLNRPAWASVPSWVLALRLGEMADMLLRGQRTLPQAALELGFRFKFTKIAPALESLEL